MRYMKNLLRFQFIKENQECLILKEIIYVSGNYEITKVHKKADHILEMKRL